MKTTGTSSSGNHRKSGFSLVEVVVAVGIVATVFVAFLGLIPLGLENMSDAGNITTQSRIAQKIIGEIQLSEWRDENQGGTDAKNSIIDSFDGDTRYYDEFGDETNDESERVYLAEIEVLQTGQGDVTLPGAEPNKYIKNAVIRVAYAPPGMQKIKFRTYTTMMADLKKRNAETK